MKKKHIGILISFIIVLTVNLSSVRGQENKPELKNKQITIKMYDKPLFDVFDYLINKYDIAIGFEESDLDKNHNDYHFETNIRYDEIKTPNVNGTMKPLSGLRSEVENHLITIDFKDAKVEVVLNSIVKQMQNYNWEINNDVVNIFPLCGRNTKFVKLMNLRIQEFVFGKDMEVGAIQPLIVLFLPEFKEFMTVNNFHIESERIAPWYIDRTLPVGMKFSDLTFKDMLNGITKSKRGGWILRKDKSSKVKDKEVIELLI